MKFKVGDRVKIKKTSEICIVILKNNIYEPEYETETVNLLNIETERYLGFFNEEDLELDDSLEQLAVKKFKEELKEKINKLLSKEFIDSLYNDSRQEVTFRVTEKKEEILKLLEE